MPAAMLGSAISHGNPCRAVIWLAIPQLNLIAMLLLKNIEDKQLGLNFTSHFEQA